MPSKSPLRSKGSAEGVTGVDDTTRGAWRPPHPPSSKAHPLRPSGKTGQCPEGTISWPQVEAEGSRKPAWTGKGGRERALISSLRPRLSALRAAILVPKVAMISGRDACEALQKLPPSAPSAMCGRDRGGRSLPWGRLSTEAPHSLAPRSPPVISPYKCAETGAWPGRVDADGKGSPPPPLRQAPQQHGTRARSTGDSDCGSWPNAPAS